jgi:undecaprenyl-diphosphatase
MTPLQAVILGLVEGITEYLPISSTGHLIITSSLLGLDGHGLPQAEADRVKEAIKAFEIVIQGGAILAVVGLYWSRFVQMLRGLMGKDNAGFALLVNLIVAFIPAAILGKLLDKKIEEHLFAPGPVVAALAIGGLYMIIVDQMKRGGLAPPRVSSADRSIEDLRPHEAILIGLMQCIAMIPGTSRSMMTITGGYFCRLKPTAAAEFSFLLGVPTLTAACLYKLYKNIAASRGPDAALHPNMFKLLGPAPLVLGLVVAAVSAAIAVKWLVGFLNRRGLTPFGWYRIVLAAALVGLIVGGVVRF